MPATLHEVGALIAAERSLIRAGFGHTATTIAGFEVETVLRPPVRKTAGIAIPLGASRGDAVSAATKLAGVAAGIAGSTMIGVDGEIRAQITAMIGGVQTSRLTLPLDAIAHAGIPGTGRIETAAVAGSAMQWVGRYIDAACSTKCRASWSIGAPDG